MNITSRITSATFSACITKKEDFPKDDLPIIALVGRSNVGKSSLINSLTGRKELARTSSTPGKTLTMNFYCINDAYYLVDLPGYGYAKASKSTRMKIQAMMDEFFTSCSNLKGVVQIVDIRHKPSPLDLQMHNWLREQRFNGFVVMTKSDKLSNTQITKMRNQILKEIRGIYAMVYSSKLVLGRDEFLDALEKILAGYEFKVVEQKTSSVNSEESKADVQSVDKPVSQPNQSKTRAPEEIQNRPKHIEKDRDRDRGRNQNQIRNNNRDSRPPRRESQDRVRQDNNPRRNRIRQPRRERNTSRRDNQ